MKKMIILALTMTAAFVMAAPITVTYQTAGLQAGLYDEFSVALASGSYAELIIRQDSIYSAAEYDDWTVLATLGYAEGPFNLNNVDVGTTAGGLTGYGDGKIGLKFYNDSYDTSYYIALRFYNSADKGSATYYGVMTPYKLTKAGSTDGAPTTELANFITSTSNTTQNRFYTDISVPAIPEPTTMALFGLGGLAMVIRRKMRKEA